MFKFSSNFAVAHLLAMSIALSIKVKQLDSCAFSYDGNWTTCGQEDEIYTFSGAKLMRYGSGAKWNYLGIYNQTPCSAKIFGIVNTTSKYCQINSSNYSWRQCASQGNSCTLKTESVVRFGLNGKYIYKLMSNTFKCEVATFGDDPVKSQKKMCEYASSTTYSVASAIQTLTPSSQSSTTVSQSTVSSTAICPKN